MDAPQRRRRQRTSLADVVWPDLPVGFWPLDDASGLIGFNAAMGSMPPDADGFRYHFASLVGGVTKQAAGPVGTRLAMALDGAAGTYVNVGTYPTFLGTTQPQSYMVAVNCPSGLSSATTGFCPFGTSSGNTYVIGLGSFTGSLTDEVVSIGNGSGLRVGWSGFTLAAGWHVFMVTYGAASDTDWSCFIDGKDAVNDLGGTLISAGGGCPGFSNQTFTLGRFVTTSYAVTIAAACIFNRRVNQYRAKEMADKVLYDA